MVPLAVLALYNGKWLDHTDRFQAVTRAIVVKVGGVILTLAFATAFLALHPTIG